MKLLSLNRLDEKTIECTFADTTGIHKSRIELLGEGDAKGLHLLDLSNDTRKRLYESPHGLEFVAKLWAFFRGEKVSTPVDFDAEDHIDPEKAEDRQKAVNVIRQNLEARFPADWYNQPGIIAAYAHNILTQFKQTGYHVVAGRVEVKEDNDWCVRYEGVYTGTGKGSYHVWLQNQHQNVLDFSMMPKEYGADFLWEPYNRLENVKYIERPEVTEMVLRKVYRK